MKYFLVGIKGSGMSSLAKILIDYGYQVEGVDVDEVFYTDTEILRKKTHSFTSALLKDDYFYIIGNSFHNHPLTRIIIDKNYEWKYYPEFIDTFFSKIKIAVAGTHGKTTTTKFLSQFLDCTYLIGDGEGRGNDKSSYFVFEACEYRNTFLNYHPYIGIISNIDYDHPDFFEDMDAVKKAFKSFSEQCDIVVHNGDCSVLREINIPNIISYGFEETNDVVCKAERQNDGYLLSISYNSNETNFFFPYLGKHQIYNFLASYTVARMCNVDDREIEEKLKTLELPLRRFQVFELLSNNVIIDYAHHPTEINSFFESLNLKYPFKEKVLIFEPHTYSRTYKLYIDFEESFKKFDIVYICEVFASIREEEKDENFFLQYDRFSNELLETFVKKKNTCFCFLGAGRNDENAKKLIDKLKQAE